MSKRFVWLKWIGVALSVLWLAGFAILAGSEWSRREADRTYYYDQCLRQTPDVAKCQSLSAAVLRESFVDVSRDFLITGIAPIVISWLIVWFVVRRSRLRRAARS